MPRGPRKPAPTKAITQAAEGYLQISQRPLHILLFLAPFLAAYEIGAVVYLSGPGGQARTIAAWGMLARFFEAFGAAGLHLPAALLVTVLLVRHVLRRDPWTIEPLTLIGMAMEACLWTIPLTIVAMLLAGQQSPAPAVIQTPDAGGILSLPWQARLTISSGAGLYEELLFRMIGIAACHALLVDVLKLPNRAGAVLSVVIPAVAFALYHRLPAGGGADYWTAATFYALSGVFFGAIYLTRGFGIVVATHALYDVLALVVIG
ncbi:MAG: CPBP family intramembrane metalloprotease [Phycisphaerales bacterium]|nr:CPBP family intramembrane metalloprotease [Phycisphaerales bacterium]